MKIERRDIDTIELSPTPDRDVQNAIRVVHNSYDVFLNIEKGKHLYKLNNGESIYRVWIHGTHGRNSQVFTEGDLMKMNYERQQGAELDELMEKYNVSKSFLHNNTNPRRIPVEKIKSEYSKGNHSQREVAQMYNVGKTTVYRIVHGKFSTQS